MNRGSGVGENKAITTLEIKGYCLLHSDYILKHK